MGITRARVATKCLHGDGNGSVGSVVGVLAQSAVSLVLSVRPEFGPMGGDLGTMGIAGLSGWWGERCRPCVCGRVLQCTSATNYCLLADCELSRGRGWRSSAWCWSPLGTGWQGWSPRGSPCTWGSMPTSWVAAPRGLGKLSWAETVGLEKALGTDPHVPHCLRGLLPQEVGRRWRLTVGAGGSGLLRFSTCSGLSQRVPHCAPHLPSGCCTGWGSLREQTSNGLPSLPPSKALVGPLLANRALSSLPQTPASCPEWGLLPGGPTRPSHVPLGLAQCGAAGDGPLVKRSCLIFLAQSLLVPTPCNDTGVNRTPGTIIIGVERQESPVGVAAADGSTAWPVPGEEPLQPDLCLRSCWVRALRPPACLSVAPRGFLPRRSPRPRGGADTWMLLGRVWLGVSERGRAACVDLLTGRWGCWAGKGQRSTTWVLRRPGGHPGATASEQDFTWEKCEVLCLGLGDQFLNSVHRGTE